MALRPQFSLRFLLWTVTLLSIWLAIAVTLPKYYLVGFTLFALMILAHFAGAAAGNVLHRPRRKSSSSSSSHPSLSAEHFAPPSNLSKEKTLQFWVLLASSIVGPLGAIIGVALTIHLTQNRVGGGGLFIAAITFGGLSGLLTFLICSFCQVIWVAWGQAVQKNHPHEECGDHETLADSVSNSADSESPQASLSPHPPQT
ncbi:MAG: hypothetical protein U0894_15625 [Pirellulales bacterium]